MVLEATLFDIVSQLAKWLIVFIRIMHLDSVPSSGESTPNELIRRLLALRLPFLGVMLESTPNIQYCCNGGNYFPQSTL